MVENLLVNLVLLLDVFIKHLLKGSCELGVHLKVYESVAELRLTESHLYEVLCFLQLLILDVEDLFD